MRYKELQEFLNTHTLNTRIKELLRHNLIQHNMVREEIRKEWYELTEDGKRVLELLNELAGIVSL